VELGRVAQITRQVLGFYREIAAAAPLRIETLLEHSIDLLSGKIARLPPRVEKQWQTLQELTAVAAELRQVFSNPLANSVDAVSSDGIIKVRFSSGRRRTGEPNVRVTIAHKQNRHRAGGASTHLRTAVHDYGRNRNRLGALGREADCGEASWHDSGEIV
jgi:signal transduction histidine kinase